MAKSLEITSRSITKERAKEGMRGKIMLNSGKIMIDTELREILTRWHMEAEQGVRNKINQGSHGDQDTNLEKL